MDILLKNYWSMYREFINDFEEVKYKGISLPYLCHFPSLHVYNGPIWNQLKHKSFASKLKVEVKSQKEFQEVYNKFILQHQKKPEVKNRQAKIVFHVDKLLRFPPHTIKSHFGSANSIILSAGNSKNGKLNQQRQSRSKEKLSGNIKKPKKAIELTNTISIKANKTKKIQNSHNLNRLSPIPIYQLYNYSTNVESSVKKIQQQVRSKLRLYKGHHLYDNKVFQQLFLNKIEVVINHIEMYQKFLKHISVSCIVVSTTHSYKNRILAIVASAQGIPTICMQHGIISSELGYIPKIATVDAVYGNFEKDWYKKAGVVKGSVEVIGHPRFDQAFKRCKLKREVFNNRLGLDSNKQTLLLAVRGKDEIGKWRELIQTISEDINLNILIKNYPDRTPHPLTKEFSFVHSTERYKLYDIFPHVDAVAAYSSTVGLEAMIANKPVFILNKVFTGYTGYYEPLDQLVQKDPRVLAAQIIKYFTDTSWKKYVNNKKKKFLRYAYPSFGTSSDRLKQLIDRLTREQVL